MAKQPPARKKIDVPERPPGAPVAKRAAADDLKADGSVADGAAPDAPADDAPAGDAPERAHGEADAVEEVSQDTKAKFRAALEAKAAQGHRTAEASDSLSGNVTKGATGAKRFRRRSGSS